MGHITKEVYTPAIVDFDKVALFSARLKSWHSSLPESLGLYRAVSGNDPKQRSTILLAHCSYLNCIILLTRRICVERIDGLGGPARVAIASEYADMCVSAGRQLATVLLPPHPTPIYALVCWLGLTVFEVVGLLHEEGRIVRRCWMLMYGFLPSFLSAEVGDLIIDSHSIGKPPTLPA